VIIFTAGERRVVRTRNDDVTLGRGGRSGGDADTACRALVGDTSVDRLRPSHHHRGAGATLGRWGGDRWGSRGAGHVGMWRGGGGSVRRCIEWISGTSATPCTIRRTHHMMCSVQRSRSGGCHGKDTARRLAECGTPSTHYSRDWLCTLRTELLHQYDYMPIQVHTGVRNTTEAMAPKFY